MQQRPEGSAYFLQVHKAARGPLFCARRNILQGASPLALLRRSSLCTMNCLTFPSSSGDICRVLSVLCFGLTKVGIEADAEVAACTAR